MQECLAPRLRFLLCVTLPSDHGNVAIRTGLARSWFGKMLWFSVCLFTCLSAYAWTGVHSPSPCVGAGSLHPLHVSRCLCAMTDATWPCGHRLLGNAHLQRATSTRVAGHRVPWALRFFWTAGSRRKPEPWHLCPGRTFFLLLFCCPDASN